MSHLDSNRRTLAKPRYSAFRKMPMQKAFSIKKKSKLMSQ